MKKTITAIALAASALLMAPVSSADAETMEERAYITTLDRQGIFYSTEDNAIEVGRALCVQISNGVSINRIIMIIMDAADLGAYDSGFITGASIAAFCPEYVPLIKSTTT